MQDTNNIINQFLPISLAEMDRVKLMNRIDTKFIDMYIEGYKKTEVKKTKISKNVTLFEIEDNVFDSLVSQNMRFLQ